MIFANLLDSIKFTMIKCICADSEMKCMLLFVVIF